MLLQWCEIKSYPHAIESLLLIGRIRKRGAPGRAGAGGGGWGHHVKQKQTPMEEIVPTLQKANMKNIGQTLGISSRGTEAAPAACTAPQNAIPPAQFTPPDLTDITDRPAIYWPLTSSSCARTSSPLSPPHSRRAPPAWTGPVPACRPGPRTCSSLRIGSLCDGVLEYRGIESISDSGSPAWESVRW